MPDRWDVDRGAQPETPVVIAIVGMIPVAVVSARVVWVVDPRPAPQRPRGGAGAPGWCTSTPDYT